MRHPRILDVLGAVREVAPGYPEVTTWWYAPPPRLRLSGELPARSPAPAALEVVVEGATEADARERIARELVSRLGWSALSVRAFRGELEARPLYRLVGTEPRS
jgi:hypothetical protein